MHAGGTMMRTARDFTGGAMTANGLTFAGENPMKTGTRRCASEDARSVCCALGVPGCLGPSVDMSTSALNSNVEPGTRPLGDRPPCASSAWMCAWSGK